MRSMKLLIAAAIAVLAAPLVTPAQAQNWPTRAV